MNKRIARIGNILNNRAGCERLCQRRAAICRRLMRAAEVRLAKLRRQQTALHNTTARQPIATVHWHQHRQRALADLDRRITRIQDIHQRLTQRAARRQAELVNAAQLRRAAQKAATRLQQQATQAIRRGQQKRFDDLIRTAQITDNPDFNATTP